MVRDELVGIDDVVRPHGLNLLQCVQSKANRRGRKLMACLFNENRVAIRDFETGEEHELKGEYSLNVATFSRYIAATAHQGGVHLFTHNGELVQEVPESESTTSVGFHSRNPSVLAIGFESDTVRIWDERARAYVYSFKEHTDYVLKASFTHDGAFLCEQDCLIGDT